MGTGFIVTETISRPLEVVWDRLTDWEQAWQWMPRVEAMQIATHGPSSTGTQLSVWTDGREHQSTIVAWEPQRRVALRSRQGAVTAVYDYGCRQRADGTTEVRLDAQCAGSGAMARLLNPVAAYLMHRHESAQLRRFKEVVETRCPG